MENFGFSFSFFYKVLRKTLTDQCPTIAIQHIHVVTIIYIVVPPNYSLYFLQHVHTSIPHVPFTDIEDDLKRHLNFDEIFYSKIKNFQVLRSLTTCLRLFYLFISFLLRPFRYLFQLSSFFSIFTVFSVVTWSDFDMGSHFVKDKVLALCFDGEFEYGSDSHLDVEFGSTQVK